MFGLDGLSALTGDGGPVMPFVGLMDGSAVSLRCSLQPVPRVVCRRVAGETRAGGEAVRFVVVLVTLSSILVVLVRILAGVFSNFATVCGALPPSPLPHTDRRRRHRQRLL